MCAKMTLYSCHCAHFSNLAIWLEGFSVDFTCIFLRVMYKSLYNTNRLYHNNKLLRINELYHSKLLRLIHSSFNNLLPPAFNNFLTLAREIHRIKTRYVANGNFFVEQINNNYGHKSPSFQCNLLWVHIPRHCKSFEKLRFKKYVFNYLLARYHQ